MHFDIITIFPEMFTVLNYGVIGRAIKQGMITINYINPRAYSTNSYGAIDGRSYGGGPGMVMMLEPLRRAIHEAKACSAHGHLMHGVSTCDVSAHGTLTHDAHAHSTHVTHAHGVYDMHSTLARINPEYPAHVMYLTPQGKLLDQSAIEQLACKQHLVMVIGRYEGVDERLVELEVDSEWSIGDYVLSGGELAAMIVIDAVTRTLPGVLGDDASSQQDSFTSGLLDYPHYTKPQFVDGMGIPSVLCSGNHQAIAQWRLKQALGRTWLRRPDLLQRRKLTNNEQVLLNAFLCESNEARTDAE